MSAAELLENTGSGDPLVICNAYLNGEHFFLDVELAEDTRVRRGRLECLPHGDFPIHMERDLCTVAITTAPVNLQVLLIPQNPVTPQNSDAAAASTRLHSASKMEVLAAFSPKLGLMTL